MLNSLDANCFAAQRDSCKKWKAGHWHCWRLKIYNIWQWPYYNIKKSVHELVWLHKTGFKSISVCPLHPVYPSLKRTYELYFLLAQFFCFRLMYLIKKYWAPGEQFVSVVRCSVQTGAGHFLCILHALSSSLV